MYYADTFKDSLCMYMGMDVRIELNFQRLTWPPQKKKRSLSLNNNLKTCVGSIIVGKNAMIHSLLYIFFPCVALGRLGAFWLLIVIY